MKDLKLSFAPSKLWLCLATALTLGACGGTGQDEGEANTVQIKGSGVAIDGYLARATVFVDSNNNGTRDAWEAWAFTDNDGYYSFNPITNTDYCAAGASAQEQQYCLVTNIEYSNVVIRIDAGYDVITGEPFLGQLSRRVNASVADEVTDSVVSPITSLLTNVESDSQRDALLTSLNITETDLDVDYLDDTTGTVNAPLLNTALKIHKVVSVLSDRLTDTYTEIGEDFGTPNDASSAVYPSLAEQIISSGTSLANVLEDENTLVAALDAAENSLREVYEQKDFTLPPDMGSVENQGDFSRIVDVVTEFNDVIDTLIDVNDTEFTLEEATGGARALEAIVIKTVEENPNAIDESIDNAINFFDVDEGDTDSQALVDALVASLSTDTADINSLTVNDFSGDDFDSVEEITDAASFDDDVKAFTTVGGKQLRMSVLGLGNRPTNSDDKEYEFYFNGQATDVDGSFSACIKHIDGANETTGELGDGNTRGELVSGFWSLLGASSTKQESYSLLLTVTFLGTTYQGILKPDGMEMVEVNGEDKEFEKIRFENNGEILKVHSENGFVDLGDIPITNQECQSRLPSRIDI